MSIFQVFILKMEAGRSSETMVSNHNTSRRHNSEDHGLNLRFLDKRDSISYLMAREKCLNHKRKVTVFRHVKFTFFLTTEQCLTVIQNNQHINFGHVQYTSIPHDLTKICHNHRNIFHRKFGYLRLMFFLQGMRIMSHNDTKY